MKFTHALTCIVSQPFDQLINQSINQSNNHPMKHLLAKSVSQLMSQSPSQSVKYSFMLKRSKNDLERGMFTGMSIINIIVVRIGMHASDIP